MDTMKDWPHTLKRNAAVVELAAAIYKARGERFGGETVLADQPPSVRAAYITRADELLKTLAPARRASAGSAECVQSVSYGNNAIPGGSERD